MFTWWCSIFLTINILNISVRNVQQCLLYIVYWPVITVLLRKTLLLLLSNRQHIQSIGCLDYYLKSGKLPYNTPKTKDCDRWRTSLPSRSINLCNPDTHGVVIDQWDWSAVINRSIYHYSCHVMEKPSHFGCRRSKPLHVATNMQAERPYQNKIGMEFYSFQLLLFTNSYQYFWLHI